MPTPTFHLGPYGGREPYWRLLLHLEPPSIVLRPQAMDWTFLLGGLERAWKPNAPLVLLTSLPFNVSSKHRHLQLDHWLATRYQFSGFLRQTKHIKLQQSQFR